MVVPDNFQHNSDEESVETVTTSEELINEVDNKITKKKDKAMKPPGTKKPTDDKAIKSTPRRDTRKNSGSTQKARTGSEHACPDEDLTDPSVTSKSTPRGLKQSTLTSMMNPKSRTPTPTNAKRKHSLKTPDSNTSTQTKKSSRK